MKLSASTLTLAVTGALLLSLGATAKAQSFTFDENGNGNINGTPVTGVLAPDPSNGGIPALTFNITSLYGATVNAGDVNVLDVNGAISDDLRFTDANGDLTGGTADRMIFYSTDLGGGQLADTGLPGNLNSGRVSVSVTEDATDHFDYGNIYHGVSGAGAVPEPGAYALLGSLGLTGAAFLRHRRAR